MNFLTKTHQTNGMFPTTGLMRSVKPWMFLNEISHNNERRITLDLPNVPTANTGLSARFQAWYRDQNPTPTANLTSGLRIDFL